MKRSKSKLAETLKKLSKHEGNGIYRLPNGTRVHFASEDSTKTLRGINFSHVILDDKELRGGK